jgi:hypothetical protein
VLARLGRGRFRLGCGESDLVLSDRYNPSMAADG